MNVGSFFDSIDNMIVNGKKIAESMLKNIGAEVDTLSVKPVLAIVAVAPNFATEKFLKIKEKTAERVGVKIKMYPLPESATTDEVCNTIGEACAHATGVVVQLPLPAHIDRREVLKAIPLSHDVDGVGSEYRMHAEDGTPLVLSPVVGAIDAIAREHSVSFLDKKVLIVGNGLLVGLPASEYAREKGGKVTTVTKDATDTLVHEAHDADILILGSGVSGIITKDMVKEGVVVFDAGTSEDDGKLSGDADPDVAKRASLFTPVPGGIGPVTVAILFKNLLMLTKSTEEYKVDVES